MSMPASDPAVKFEHHLAIVRPHELVARTQRPPLLCCRLIAAEAKGSDVVIEGDIEPVRRRTVRLAKAVDELVTNEPAGLSGDRAHLNRAEGRSDRTAAAVGVERTEPAAWKQG